MTGIKVAEPAIATERRADRSVLAPPSDPMGSSLFRMLRFERRWLVRVFELLLPRGADDRMPFGAADVPMGRFVDDLLREASLEFVAGLRICLWMVMLAPMVVLKRMRSFLAISLAEQATVLERLRTSDVYLVREAPMLLKTIACLGFCGLAPVQAALGIHPIDASPPSWAAKEGRAP
jgi:hypothetical protein